MSRMSELDMDRQALESFGPDDDIAGVTYALREGAKEALARRSEIGAKELQDIIDAVSRLTEILKNINDANQRVAA